MTQWENNTHLFRGFVAGAAVGALAGLLFTPMSGRRMRRSLRRAARDVRERVSDSVIAIAERGEETMERIGDRMVATSGSVRRATRSMVGR